MKYKLLIISFLIILFITACMSLQKATDKVLDSKSATDKVGRVWAIENPCVNDTTIIKGDTVYKPGSIQIVEKEVPFIVNDTTIRFVDVDLDTTIEGVRLRLYNGHFKLRVPKQEPDTIQLPGEIHYVVDNRLLKIYKDSAEYYKGLSIQKQTNIDQLKNDNLDKDRLLRNARFAMFAVIGIFLIIIFRKPIFSLIAKFL